MFVLLWLIPALPFAGFFLLVLVGDRLSRRVIALIGVGSVGLSALLSLLVGFAFLVAPPSDHVYTQTIWRWLDVAGFSSTITLHLDALSLVMVLVIAFVGFLIHLYSTAYMRSDPGYGRFFAYMNLFVGAMLTLVLADDLLVLLLGWEGVGLCSYLLIGFWYQDPATGRAAQKAFIVTRVGDTALIVGLFLLLNSLGTLRIGEVLVRAAQNWPPGAPVAVAVAALLLGGALGKSAQLPLQTWLPDAMAGPTPVSALIHAATMVTAGVYLIARTHVLFTLAPVVLTAVAVIGALTLLYAGFSALAQSDIKRALAYSTISQIGYMFLALGVGAWSAAIFHFMTHAFFKALLFLSAGVIILALGHEQNMYRMGGLRKQLPLAFWTFLVGAASLSAVPLVTAGFYSKDAILFAAWSSPLGSPLLWAAGIVGALLTALYSFRVLFLAFCGQPRREVDYHPDLAVRLPLVVLAVLAVGAGFLELPRTLGQQPLFSDFLAGVLPPVAIVGAPGLAAALQVVSAAAALIGIYLAYQLYLRRPQLVERVERQSVGAALHRFWLSGWGFDWLYDRLIVRPFVSLARSDKDDLVDRVYGGIADLARALNGVLSRAQSGHLRRYALGIALGAAILLAIGMLA